jgi:sugar phosphate permease
LDTTTHDALWARWQRRIFVTSWITYASFYLGRVNLAVALPALQDQFGWAKAQAGLIDSAFFWAYAVGQLVNGAFGDRVNVRASEQSSQGSRGPPRTAPLASTG